MKYINDNIKSFLHWQPEREPGSGQVWSGWDTCHTVECKRTEHKWQHTCTHKWQHTCTHTHKHTYIHIQIHTHTQTHTHTHVCARTHARTHAHTHTHSLLCPTDLSSLPALDCKRTYPGRPPPPYLLPTNLHHWLFDCQFQQTNFHHHQPVITSCEEGIHFTPAVALSLPLPC